MAQDKQFRRMEAKIDALLEKAGIDVASFDTQQQAAKQERKLSPQEQDALNNAPQPKPDLRGIPAENGEADDASRTTERTSEERDAPAVPRSQGKK